MELQDRSRLYPSLAPQGGLIMGSDGRLQYAPISQVSNAPSAPPAPAGYSPPSNQRMVSPSPQVHLQNLAPSAAVSNPDISDAQASLNRWSKWVKILSALILAINITVHVAWFVDLAYPSDHSPPACKFYIVARILAFILITVTARAGIKASRSKTSESAKWFIKLLILSGLFLLVVFGFISYKRMQKFRRHGGKWKGKRHGGKRGRHGKKFSDNDTGIDANIPHNGGRGLNGDHTGIDKDIPHNGGRGLNGDHTGIDANIPHNGGRGLNGDHTGIDKDIPHNGGRGLNGDHTGIDKDIPHNGGRGLNGDHTGIDKDIPHNGGRGLNGDHTGIDKDIPHGGRVLRTLLADELLNGLRDLKDRDEENESQGSDNDDENSQSGDNQSEGNSKVGSRKGSKKSRSNKSSRSGKSDTSSNGDKDEEKGSKGEHGGKYKGKHGKKYRGCHTAVCWIAGLVVYSLLMFFAIKLYRAAKNYEAIVQRGNVPIVPVMYNQPVLAFAPGMNPGNIPMGAPIQH